MFVCLGDTVHAAVTSNTSLGGLSLGSVASYCLEGGFL